MEACNDAQQTPLLLAIVSGQVQAALTLMESGASLDVVDLDHKNPLHLATEKENMTLLKVRHFHAYVWLMPSPSGLHSCCGDSGKRDGYLSVVGM